MSVGESAVEFRVMWAALRQCLRKQIFPLDWMLSESRGKFHDWFSEKASHLKNEIIEKSGR